MDAPPLSVLADVVRESTGADRVEAEIAGEPPYGSGTARPGSRASVFRVVGDDGPLVELRVFGAPPERLDGDVVPAAASLLAAAAGRARRPEQERAWVGRLGHDLKTPLTAILGFAGLLGGGGVAAATPELTAASRQVTEAGERLLLALEEDLARWRR